MFFFIMTIISFFKTTNSVQPWPFQGSVGPQPYPQKVDLELCIIWPWQRPQPLGRSILDINVIKCQANEVCTPTQPETQIHGLILGRCKVLMDPPKSTTKPSMVALVVTGIFGIVGRQRVEIIKENFETEVCYKVQEYPLPVSTAAGSRWDDGKVTVCGGWNWPNRHSECYSLENGEWKLNSQELQKGRSGLAGSNIGNSIWITGGYGDDKTSRGLRATETSTEIIHTDGKITPGPNLPEPRSFHCQTSYKQTTFIIGGGADGMDHGQKSVWKFDSNNLNTPPYEMPSMVYGRSGAACTVYNSLLHGGRPVLIVVGSRKVLDLSRSYISGYPESKTAEILDYTVEGATWQEIEELPVQMFLPRMTSTSKGDNVILTYDTSVYTLSISGSKYSWTKMPHELSIARAKHVQVLVPASTIQCN